MRALKSPRFSKVLKPALSVVTHSPRLSAAVTRFPSPYRVKLQVRTDLHLARKTWHMTMGLFIVFIFTSGMSVSRSVMLLSSFLCFDLFMETARLKIPALNQRVVRLWGPLMRAHEVNRFSTVPYYVAASALAIAIFPRPVAALSILYLACGDPLASLFGILYGHKSIRLASGKTLIGTLAGVVTCALITLVFLHTLPVSLATLAVLTLVGGVAGGTAELVPLDMDDNFTIPLISGFVMWLAFILLGL